MLIIQLMTILMILHNGGTQGSETGATGISLDLPHTAERNLSRNYLCFNSLCFPSDNITFFNGVFENVESVALFFDCLGSHFTWLQSVFTSFPPLLNFVSRMKCVTGICPRDFEDYGCACRFETEGFPVDEVDGCCFQHRKCYEEATEEECTWDPTKITMNVSCLTKNITCGSEDSCEHLLCNCDKEAIECFLHSPVNSSLNNFDATLCSSLVTETSSVKIHTTVPASVTAELESNSNTDYQRGRKEGEGGDVPQDSRDLPLNNHERFSSDAESSGVLEIFRGGAVTQKDATIAFDNSELRGLSESYLATIRTTTPSPGISTPEADFMPVSEFPRPANSGHLFKLAGEEPVTFSTTIPEESPSPEESFREACDRFSFLQRGDNGKLQQEFPQLGEMLYCLTNRCPEEFELYGCFCGQEGRGHPTDELDRCCFSHQCCLEQVKRLGCQPEKKSSSEVVCFDHTPTCVGWTLCENLLCSCDKAAAECMAAAPFNESWRLSSRQACQEDKLACRWAGRVRPPSSPPRGARTSSEEEESSSEETNAARPLLRRGKRAIRNGRRRSRILPLQTR
ncbi:otoconin-90 [Pseudonaja textilis]|uniref:otoconin-90 n=1 Tax=Pseudonaja textilis TaxID=8673 RepID=UPI000EA8B450|nr:otoconin-90 [Pseudonaja textilis]